MGEIVAAGRDHRANLSSAAIGKQLALIEFGKIVVTQSNFKMFLKQLSFYKVLL